MGECNPFNCSCLVFVWRQIHDSGCPWIEKREFAAAMVGCLQETANCIFGMQHKSDSMVNCCLLFVTRILLKVVTFMVAFVPSKMRNTFWEKVFIAFCSHKPTNAQNFSMTAIASLWLAFKFSCRLGVKILIVNTHLFGKVCRIKLHDSATY